MNKKQKIFLVIILALFLGMATFLLSQKGDEAELPENNPSDSALIVEEKKIIEDQDEVGPPAFSLAIQSLRNGSYPGGDFTTEENLPNGSNYRQLVVSYRSEGLKINGLLTVPLSSRPEGGYPAIIFLHGYIPPKQYSTKESYPTYQAALARAGFITFKPDLRGHADSEGEPVSAHYSEKYVVDTLNAIAYLKKYDQVNSEKIGYWGHSNGGQIGLRIAVANQEDIKAYSFWAGVVGSYEDMLETYNEKIPFLRNGENPLIKEYGLPGENPDFWNSVDPFFYLEDISAPIQLHHGTNDKSVPVELSESLEDALAEAGKKVELFKYQGDHHDISQNSGLAWQRTIDFFRENL